jgi:hypothetical protein
MQRRRLVQLAPLLAATLLAGHAARATTTEAGSDHAAALAAVQWLALLDKADYAGSWAQTGSAFRNAVTAEEWTGAAMGTRGRMGYLKERKNKTVRLTNTLPGVPDGEYAVVQYDTAFEKKEKAQESLTLVREPDGAWRVVGYFIR